VCRNLIESALKYSATDSPITALTQSSSHGIKIDVRNSGNVCYEDIAQMTSRFWRKGEAGGAGLGLSIFNAVAKKYRGSLMFKNEGAQFLVIFALPMDYR
jgi:two-component system sensor histidine kinase QseC